MLVVLIIGAFPASAADFYETQLQLGAEAYRTGRLPEAIDYLRIANFGLMDRPPLLLEGIARLALVMDAAGRKDDLLKTLDRFVAVERQFPTWADVEVEPDLRRRFEQLLRENVSSETLKGITALSSGTSSDEDVSAMSSSKRKSHYDAKAKGDPDNARWLLLKAKEEASSGAHRAALRSLDAALAIDNGLVEARVLKLDVLTARKEWSEAAAELRLLPINAWVDYPRVNANAFVIYTKANDFESADRLYDRIPAESAARPDVAEAMAAFRLREASRLEEQAMADVPDNGEAGDPVVPPASPVRGPEEPVAARMSAPRGSFTKPADPVAEALRTSTRLIGEGRTADAQLVLRDAIRAAPGSRELRLAMLEASCLGRDWRTGVSQLLLIEPFSAGEEKYMFYGAVVYFESQRRDEATELMRSALPKLARSPFVDHYARLLLGE